MVTSWVVYSLVGKYKTRMKVTNCDKHSSLLIIAVKSFTVRSINFRNKLKLIGILLRVILLIVVLMNVVILSVVAPGE
jgi:hypothetical protein